MNFPLRLFINQLCKNVTKTSNIHAENLRQNSIIISKRFHDSSSGTIIAKKMHGCNLAYTDSNKFQREIKSELLNSNLESLPSWGCNKPMKNIDTKQCKTCQLANKLPFLSNFSEKYRLSYYEELPEYGRDSIESELFDFQNVLDPSYRIKVFQELVEEMKRQTEQEKFYHDTSGPITWNLIS